MSKNNKESVSMMFARVAMRKEILAPFENKTKDREKILGAYLEKMFTIFPF